MKLLLGDSVSWHRRASSRTLPIEPSHDAALLRAVNYDEAESRRRKTSRAESIDSKTGLYPDEGFRVEISMSILRNNGQSFEVQYVVRRIEGNVGVKDPEHDNSDGAPGMQGAISETAYLAAMGANKKCG